MDASQPASDHIAHGAAGKIRPRRTLVCLATYNEAENLPELVSAIWAGVADCDILVIDDNSPDGTGAWCAAQSAANPRFFCVHRPGKLGLGTATLAGFRYAVTEGYEFLVTLDADFSHNPQSIPVLLDAVRAAPAASLDVAIGSRYVAGGKIEGWPAMRRFTSRATNFVARWWLGLKVRDCSGSFRCYRVAKLRQLDLRQLRSKGYSIYEEVLCRLAQCGATFAELPITFRDRERGQTKVNLWEAFRAITRLLWLGLHLRIDRFRGNMTGRRR